MSAMRASRSRKPPGGCRGRAVFLALSAICRCRRPVRGRTRHTRVLGACCVGQAQHVMQLLLLLVVLVLGVGGRLCTVCVNK